MDPRELEKRSTYFALGLLAIFVVLSLRLGFLQVVHGAEYDELSRGQRVRKLALPAPRGNIYDRNGELLATNRPSFALSISYTESGEFSNTVRELDRLLGTRKSASEVLRAEEKEPLRLSQKGVIPGSLVLTTPDGFVTYKEGHDYEVNYYRSTVKLSPRAGILPGSALVASYDYSEIQQKVLEGRMRPFEPVRVKRDLSPDLHTQLEERRMEMPGTVIDVQPIREYPHGRLAAHLLGYVGEIGESQLQNPLFQGYKMGDIVGKTGVEFTYDRKLRGKDGARLVEVDYKGRPVRVYGEQEAVPGENLVLTIDVSLQKALEDALDETMEKPRNDPAEPRRNATAGAGVVMDARTGEILAMASRPFFDPNSFSAGISREDFEQLLELKAFNNRAIAGLYPPGSAFKMVTAVAALEEKKVTLDEIFDTTGGIYWRVPKKCWKPGGFGKINLIEGIAKSCNLVFYELGYRLGIDLLADYARRFGLDTPTGLRDLPGEATGLVPDRAWKASSFPEDPRWYLGETLNSAIGQGYHKYTPLQMANYVAMIANGGTRYRPYLVSRIVSHDGSVIKEFEPEVLGRLKGVSASTLEAVRKGMLAVTQPGGTAYWRFSDFPVKVAGKTGTVEVDKEGMDPHGWFVGFAPYENPEIAFAVLIEHGGGGSLAAAPVARAVLEEYFGLAASEEPRWRSSRFTGYLP